MTTRASVDPKIADIRAATDDMVRRGKWYIAPRRDPSDAYTAGWDGNVFDSETEASDAIPDLSDALQTAEDYWVVRRYT